MHDARKHGVVGVHVNNTAHVLASGVTSGHFLHHITYRPLRYTALRDVIHIDDVRNLDQLYMSTWCGGRAHGQ